jgi:hypothetical protein
MALHDFVEEVQVVVGESAGGLNLGSLGPQITRGL